MKKLIAVVLMLVAAWASLAQAQATGSDGKSNHGNTSGAYISGLGTGDSLFTTIRASSTGGLKISDESRDRDYVALFSDAINNASLALGAADSSTVLSVGAYRYLKLLIKCTPKCGTGGTCDTAGVVRLIFQFREHANSVVDSNNTFAEYLYGYSQLGIAVAADTVGMGHQARGNAASPWSGEYVVYISTGRNAVASGIDVNGRLFYYPNGLSIPLDSFFGRPARFDKLSIRVRNGGSNTTAASGPVKINVAVKAFAQ